MKIVYALVCSEKNGANAFFDMAAVSGTSVKLSNKRAKVVVATDTGTRELLEERQHLLLKIVDEWVFIHVPKGERRWRSRFLKTSLAFHIQGPFLFLDADTLVRGSIDEVFLLSSDLAAATNESTTDLSKQIGERHRKILNLLSWPIGDRDYFNSGVIFFSGSMASYKFAKAWHAAWLYYAEVTQSYEDQLAFNHALNLQNVTVEPLPDTYNAQISPAPEVAYDATIWHFYSTTIESYGSLLTKLVRIANHKPAKYLPSAVSRELEKRFPWTLKSQPYHVEVSIWDAVRRGARLRWSEVALLIWVCPSGKNMLFLACYWVGISYPTFRRLVEMVVDLKVCIKNLAEKVGKKHRIQHVEKQNCGCGREKSL